MRVLIGCVAENNDKFLAQALRLVHSVRWFGGRLARADFLVVVVEGDGASYATELRALDALVRPVPRLDPRLPHGNKVSLFAQPEVDDYDTVLYLDCDVLMVQDPADYLSASHLRAKIADGPTVPHTALERLCRHLNLPPPSPRYLTTNVIGLTAWYASTGAINLPVGLINEVLPLWRHYMTYLADHPELFDEHFHFCQAGLALAYQARPVPFARWPLAMNYPLHLAHWPAPPEMLASDPIILHYHTRVDQAGLLLPTPYTKAQARLEQFNARLRARMAEGWQYPTLGTPPAQAGLAAAIQPAPAPAEGTILIDASAEPERLRQRLDQFFRANAQAASPAVLVGSGGMPAGVANVVAALGVDLPYVALRPECLEADLTALQAQVRTDRVAYWEDGSDYAAPAWSAVPARGEALLPWLPPIQLPADTMRPPAARASGWLAPSTFLAQLRAAERLADWSLWTLADQGVAGRKLDWLSAPAVVPPIGAEPARSRTRPITGAARILAVVPHYNCAAYLEQTLQGLLRQTRPLDGILVVDDGSDQSPAEIVSRYPDVTLWRSTTNAGLYRVLQAVIDQADYDAYFFQDADDWPAVDRLALCLAEAERTGAAVIGSQEMRLVCDESLVKPTALPLDVNLASRLRPTGLPLLLATSLVSRALLQRLGGLASGMALGADTELVQRAIYAARVVNLPYYAYYRRKRPNSMTTRPETVEGSPAQLAWQHVSHARALANRERIVQGQAPDLTPPVLGTFAHLNHEHGPAVRLAPGTPAPNVTATPDPVCVAGMHRSGTSMITRLLNLCGLHLGPAEVVAPPSDDNEAGYWEHQGFLSLNEAVLGRQQAAWDWPPAESETRFDEPEWVDLRAQAASLIASLQTAWWWGWKDPRSSLTLPFWQALLPKLRVVICVRHPAAVSASFQRRGSASKAYAWHLWEIYNTRLLASVPPQQRVITHYDSYFADPDAELRRVLAALEVSVPDAVMQRAVGSIAGRLRHHQPAQTALPPRLEALYERLCAEAGPVYAQARSLPPSNPPAAASTAAPAEPAPPGDPATWQEVRSAIAWQSETLLKLDAQLAQHKRQLEAVQEKRAAELAQLQQALASTAESAARAEAALAQQRATAQALHDLQRSRWVRLATAYWRLRWHLSQMPARLRARLDGQQPRR